MLAVGAEQKDMDYIFEGAGKHLCVWPANVYDRYTRYRKDYAIAGEALTVSQFYQQLQLRSLSPQKTSQNK